MPVQHAIRGEWRALYEDCNAAMASKGHFLRASREAALRFEGDEKVFERTRHRSAKRDLE